MKTLLAAILISVLPFATTGCKSVECGDGTIDRDGTCVPGDENPEGATCGPFTELAPSGQCEPILEPTVCDDATTEQVTDPETGVITCVGTGAGSCESPMPGCTASANRMTVCGRLYDLENDTQVGAGSTDTSPCPLAGESTGPCSLVIRAYDAQEFAPDPGGAIPLVMEENVVDHCGRFRLKNIETDGAIFLGLGVIPHPASASPNRVTGVALPAQAGPTGGVATNVVAYTTRAATDAAWAAALGMGPSLAPGGVYVNIFREPGTSANPFAGSLAQDVRIEQNGVSIPSFDYYFSDADAERTTPDEDLTETGVNGTGLVLNQGAGFANYGGTDGPLPDGCSWSIHLGQTVVGVFFVQTHTTLPLGADCSF